jgi:zinc protease
MIADQREKHEMRLWNGMQLLIVGDYTEVRVACELQILGAGGYYDQASEAGLAEFASRLLRAGTSRRSASEIEKNLMRWGSKLRVDTASGSTAVSLHLSCEPANLPEVLEFLYEVVTMPRFPSQDVKALQDEVAAHLREVEGTPSLLANSILVNRLYEPHPGSKPIQRASNVDRFTSERLAAFVRERYVPDHAVLAIMGNISAERATSLASGAFVAWSPAGRKLSSVPPAVPGRAGLVCVQVDGEGLAVQIGTTTPNRGNSDYELVEVIHTILGTYRIPGRLWALRECHGEVFSEIPYGLLLSQAFGGSWMTPPIVTSNEITLALDSVLGELRKMRTQLTPDAELEGAKAALASVDVLDWKDPLRARMLGHLGVRMFDLARDYWDKRAERIAAITAEQVRAIAQKYFDPGRLHVVVAGSAKRLSRELDGWEIS